VVAKSLYGLARTVVVNTRKYARLPPLGRPRLLRVQQPRHRAHILEVGWCLNQELIESYQYLSGCRPMGELCREDSDGRITYGRA
jgi:hypothetical protein